MSAKICKVFGDGYCTPLLWFVESFATVIEHFCYDFSSLPRWWKIQYRMQTQTYRHWRQPLVTQLSLFIFTTIPASSLFQYLLLYKYIYIYTYFYKPFSINIMEHRVSFTSLRRCFPALCSNLLYNTSTETCCLVIYIFFFLYAFLYQCHGTSCRLHVSARCLLAL